MTTKEPSPATIQLVAMIDNFVRNFVRAAVAVGLPQERALEVFQAFFEEAAEYRCGSGSALPNESFEAWAERLRMRRLGEALIAHSEVSR